MRTNRIPVVFCVFGAVVAMTASPKPHAAEQICAKTACRPATAVKLPVDEEHYQEFTIPKSPYVDDGTINVLPGEVLNVTVVQADGKLAALRYSKNPSDLRITFEVRREPKPESYLALTNNTDKAIVYRALVNSLGTHSKHGPTSTCPIPAKLTSLEHWPYSIAQPVLLNFRFAGPKDSDCMVY